MTANAMSGDREICLGAGINDHVAKPLTHPALRAIVDRRAMVKVPAAKA